MTGSSRFLGGCNLTAESHGSTPNDCAGGPSMMMLIHNTWVGFNGGGNPSTFAPATIPNAAKEVDSWKVRKFRMLWKIAFPSSTAATIDPSSSSARTTSAASLATSVPIFPIATPTSAARSAGASFTPSPVIATTLPACLKSRTTASLCLGETLYNTATRCTTDETRSGSLRGEPQKSVPPGVSSSVKSEAFREPDAN